MWRSFDPSAKLRAGFAPTFAEASAFAILLKRRLRRNQLPPSLFYFAGGYLENCYGGQVGGQAGQVYKG